ncbi:Uncharacterized protein dnm_053010 [Desulfonema magnum]|uniref:Uncharacterized protein n=1 Tax=Desulfonema magnum TaxID=45655 RepID=A0A975BPE5_9BACT|nr:Uncharacterized protein dnm_053010 [Desulfonema magnum]
MVARKSVSIPSISGSLVNYDNYGTGYAEAVSIPSISGSLVNYEGLIHEERVEFQSPPFPGLWST